MVQAKHEGYQILAYYRGAASDNRSRYLAQIQKWPDEQLEFVHDFIQWMFPLHERSGANPNAPILDSQSVAEFRSNSTLKATLRVSMLRMFRFYGLELRTEPSLEVSPAKTFVERSESWLTWGNHNHLRLTRIIKCLRLLGMEPEADALFKCLAAIYREEVATGRSRISEKTFKFWEAASREIILS